MERSCLRVVRPGFASPSGSEVTGLVRVRCSRRVSGLVPSGTGGLFSVVRLGGAYPGTRSPPLAWEKFSFFVFILLSRGTVDVRHRRESGDLESETPPHFGEHPSLRGELVGVSRGLGVSLRVVVDPNIALRCLTSIAGGLQSCLCSDFGLSGPSLFCPRAGPALGAGGRGGRVGSSLFRRSRRAQLVKTRQAPSLRGKEPRDLRGGRSGPVWSSKDPQGHGPWVVALWSPGSSLPPFGTGARRVRPRRVRPRRVRLPVCTVRPISLLVCWCDQSPVSRRTGLRAPACRDTPRSVRSPYAIVELLRVRLKSFAVLRPFPRHGQGPTPK